MKKFLIKSFCFLLLPVFMVYLFIELFLHFHPSVFSKKAEFIKENQSNVEVIFLGSSHATDAINPKYFSLITANLANGSQDYQLDSALLVKYIKSPNLKYIIAEVDYLDFFKERETDFYRYPWYEKYYGFKLGDYPKYHVWCTYLSNPDFFNLYFKSLLFENLEEKVNKYGYDEVNAKGKFFESDYDSIKIMKSASNQMKPFDLKQNKNLKTNLRRLKFLKDLTQSNQKTFIQITYPMHASYNQELTQSDSYKYWKEYLENEKNTGNIVWEFENSVLFKTNEFANSSHLNFDGSIKFSKLVNDSIVQLNKKNL